MGRTSRRQKVIFNPSQSVTKINDQRLRAGEDKKARRKMSKLEGKEWTLNAV